MPENLRDTAISDDIALPKSKPSTPVDWFRAKLRKRFTLPTPLHHGRPMILWAVTDFDGRTTGSYRCRKDGCKRVKF